MAFKEMLGPAEEISMPHVRSTYDIHPHSAPTYTFSSARRYGNDTLLDSARLSLLPTGGFPADQSTRTKSFACMSCALGVSIALFHLNSANHLTTKTPSSFSSQLNTLHLPPSDPALPPTWDQGSQKPYEHALSPHPLHSLPLNNFHVLNKSAPMQHADEASRL